MWPLDLSLMFRQLWELSFVRSNFGYLAGLEPQNYGIPQYLASLEPQKYGCIESWIFRRFGTIEIQNPWISAKIDTIEIQKPGTRGDRGRTAAPATTAAAASTTAATPQQLSEHGKTPGPSRPATKYPVQESITSTKSYSNSYISTSDNQIKFK